MCFPFVTLINHFKTVKSWFLNNKALLGLLISTSLFVALMPLETDYAVTHPQAPSPKNLLGTTSEGYSSLVYLIHCIWGSAMLALCLVPISFFLGCFIGACQGLSLNRLDFLFQRIAEGLSCIPLILILVVLSQYDYLNFWIFIALKVCFIWPAVAVQARSVTIEESKKDYVRFAKHWGLGTRAIAYKIVFPQVLKRTKYLLPRLTVSALSYILILDFLNVELPLSLITLASPLKEGYEQHTYSWLFVSSIIVTVALTIWVYTYLDKDKTRIKENKATLK